MGRTTPGTTPGAERPPRGLANFFVPAAAVAVGAVAVVLAVDVGPTVVLAGDVGPTEAAFKASWAPPSEAQAVLDFEFYRENVEPIFLRGHGEGGLVPGACVMCHSWQVGTPFKLQPLQHDAGGDPYWDEARSRHNYEGVSRLVPQIGRAGQQEWRDRTPMPYSACKKKQQYLDNHIYKAIQQQ